MAGTCLPHSTFTTGTCWLSTRPKSALVNSLKGVSARRLRQRYRVRTHREYLWSPSYFAASCGGVPPSIIQAYVEGQRKPD